MAISATTSYLSYSSTPTLPKSIPVIQLATDQLENIYGRTSTAPAITTRPITYYWLNNYPVTVSGYAPLATYALTGGSTNVAAAVIQIWKTGV